MKDVLVRIKSIKGIQISPYILKHAESVFWMSWTWAIKKLLRAAETSDGYEFTVGDITYVAIREEALSTSDLEFYADSVWRSALEIPFLKLGTV